MHTIFCLPLIAKQFHATITENGLEKGEYDLIFWSSPTSSRQHAHLCRFKIHNPSSKVQIWYGCLSGGNCMYSSWSHHIDTSQPFILGCIGEAVLKGLEGHWKTQPTQLAVIWFDYHHVNDNMKMRMMHFCRSCFLAFVAVLYTSLTNSATMDMTVRP